MNPRYRFFLLTVGLFAGLTAGFYYYTYLQLQLVQALIVPIVIGSLVIFIPPILVLMSRGRVAWAGVLVLVGLAVAYAGNELIWQGLTAYNLIGGILLIVLTGNFVLPRRFGVWFAVSLFYAGLILVINLVPALPFVRYDYSYYPIIFPFSLGANLLLGLAILAQVLIEFQASSIRTRLLATFVLLVFLPVSAIGALTSIVNASNAQQRALDQLESVVTLKNAEIQTWENQLEADLLHYLPTSEEMDLITQLFAQTAIQQLDPAVSRIISRVRSALPATDLFLEISYLNLNGRVMLSTEPERIGFEQATTPYFKPALSGIYRSSLMYSPTANQNVIIVAAPIVNKAGETIGVIAGRANLKILTTLMSERSGLGKTGETYLVTNQRELLSNSLVYPLFLQGSKVISVPIRTLIEKATSPDLVIQGSGQYVSYHKIPVLGYYRWLPGLEMELFAEQQQAEALASTYESLLYTVILSVVSVILAFLVGLYAVRRISQPLGELASTAQRIAAGNLALQASGSLVAGLDEIGSLARAFNSMTAQLRELVDDLEKRVDERTAALEARSRQLQLAAETARDATTPRDLDELLNRAVYLIRERFSFVQVLIYLLDAPGEVAVLAARTEGGSGLDVSTRPLVERLRLDQADHPYKTGSSELAAIFAEVMRSGTAQVARQSMTRVQLVLPLRSAGKMIGVLDVQSTSSLDAFDPNLIAVLQIVADQLAISIDSARLLRQTRETLRELQGVYSNYTRNAWQSQIERMGDQVSYRYRGLQVEPVNRPAALAAGVDDLAGQVAPGNVYSIPLRLRDEVIGQLDLQFDEGIPSSDVVGIYAEMANRLSLLLENARLLNEAQGLAAKEQQINQIANQVRSSVNLEAILRNTVRELGSTFGASRTFIQITPAFNEIQAPTGVPTEPQGSEQEAEA